MWRASASELVFAVVLLVVGCGGSEPATDAGGADAAPVDAGSDAASLDHCGNGTRDGDESDRDCGGSCAPCPVDDDCGVATDCLSGVCGAAGRCLGVSCANGFQDSSETDVDCGGPCDPCADGLSCAYGFDCASEVCAEDICRVASCGDGVQDGDESDVDCGGSCGTCALGAMCAEPLDCESLVCRGEGSCRDGCFGLVGVDCGGVSVAALNGPSEDIEFGRAIAIDGERIVVGAPKETDYAGAAYVFRRDGTEWTLEQRLVPSAPERLAQFGAFVAIDGDAIAVSATYEGGPGAGYVFRLDGSWTEEQRLPLSTAQGAAVAIDGDHLAITSRVYGAETSVNLYERSGGTWGLVQTIAGEDGSGLGESLSFDGDRLALGSPLLTGSLAHDGAVHLYTWDGGTWSEEAVLLPSAPTSQQNFGNSIELQGDVLFVGAQRNYGGTGMTPDAGVIYRFVLGAEGWTLVDSLGPRVPGEGDRFATQVALAGELLWASAMNEDGNGTLFDGDRSVDAVASEESGAIYGLRDLGGALGWRELVYLKPPVSGVHFFGRRMVAEGSYLVATASSDSSADDLVWVFDFTRPVSAEVCDGFDNDLNGEVDEAATECSGGCELGLCQ